MRKIRHLLFSIGKQLQAKIAILALGRQICIRVKLTLGDQQVLLLRTLSIVVKIL